MKRHKQDSKAFAELTFAEQAKSINAMINNLAAAMRNHVRTSKQSPRTRNKCIGQLQRMLGRL